MGVRKLRLLLHMLFFFSSSLSPSQTRLVSASNQAIRGREMMVVNRRGGGGGHGGGGGGGRGGGGGSSGHGEGGGSNGKAKGLAAAGVVPLYAAGALNHQNYNHQKNPHHHGSNSCTTNYNIGLPQLPNDVVTTSFCESVVVPMMALLTTPLSASLTIGEDDAVLASFGDHRRSFWGRC
uniref:Uncharacterized protein n=1 Tax=Vitis vinifera TaxID=29760 RepID=F6HHF0_VITVI